MENAVVKKAASAATGQSAEAAPEENPAMSPAAIADEHASQFFSVFVNSCGILASGGYSRRRIK